MPRTPYYTYSRLKNSEYPEATSRNGKWLVFVDAEHRNSIWSLITTLLQCGKLGDTAKISKQNTINGNSVICVYTYDYDDIEDKERIKNELLNIGITQNIPYKSDAKSREESEQRNRELTLFMEHMEQSDIK